MSTAVLPSRGFLNNRLRRESFGYRPPPPLKKPLRSPPRRKPKPKPSPPKKPPADGHDVTVSKRDDPLRPSPAAGLVSYGEGSPGLSSIYAGPAYSVSPEPSSLPFPAVFVKSEMATRRLRCLLRLDELAA